jgi:hypothetical protein
MKKCIVWALLVFSISNTDVFANPGNGISKQIEAEFHKRFLNAEDVQWEKLDDFVRATFSLNGSVLIAYFHPNGDLIAVTRNILSDQLPINLMITLKSKYVHYWIVDLFEVDSHGKTFYFVTLNSADQEVILKSEEGGDWKVFNEESEQP